MNKLIVSSSPHFKTSHDTPRIMLDVIIALLPTFIAGVFIYGIRALLVVATCVLTCVVSEFVFNLILKKEQSSVQMHPYGSALSVASLPSSWLSASSAVLAQTSLTPLLLPVCLCLSASLR